jgi:hypothetical protein
MNEVAKNNEFVFNAVSGAVQFLEQEIILEKN